MQNTSPPCLMMTSLSANPYQQQQAVTGLITAVEILVSTNRREKWETYLVLL